MLKSQSKADNVDLLVIGGGINGCSVARDAAGRGLSVMLCEKGDLAEGTSSRSGKYIHGGLRYLEYYEFRLVRRALIERENVLEAAPHIAWPLRLVLPHSPEQRPRWLIRLGLLLYDNLGGRKRVPGTRAIDLLRNPEGAPIRDEFTRGFAYFDVWCDDARLTVLNAVDASRRGAEILTQTECVSAKRDGNQWQVALRDTLGGCERTITARAIFNAAGPWLEKIIDGVARVNSSYRIRLVKGSHIVMRKWWDGNHGYVLQAEDRRIIFVNPWLGNLALVGTTDIPFDGRPEDVQIDESEIDYLLAILNRYFRKPPCRSDIIHTYSGVRALYDDDSEKNASAVTRDYAFELDGGKGKAPIISAFGGKITTFRRFAEHGMHRLKHWFPAMGPDWTNGSPLPGGDIPNADFHTWFAGFRDRHSWVPESLCEHYARNYGTLAEHMLAEAKCINDLGRHFGALCYQIEIDWLIKNEWARAAEDVLTRRTRHAFFLDQEQIDVVGSYCAKRLDICQEEVV